METIKHFTIRVYGIFIKNESILLSDEVYNEKTFTKFPGGGLEWGEGTSDTLHREIREELHIEIKNLQHFYTTDFFAASTFDKYKQVICIYYTADFETDISSSFFSNRPTKNLPKKGEWFRWIPLKELSKTDLTFPTDQYVVNLVKEAFE